LIKKVYCGHEYTIQNLKFSLHVEPDNQVTKKKLEWAIEKRNINQPTIPSTICEEKLYNPFMRVDLDSLKNRYKETDSIICMRQLRKEKDNWKPT
jgi:hydroxyacylglutathione hydrolase